MLPTSCTPNPRFSQFEEVVVTANKIEQPLSEVAGSVAVIDGEQIEKNGATELYDAIRNEPGVSVSGGAGRPQNITIRGMTGNRILVVKDGIKSSDGFGANDINDKVGRNSFDLADIDSIEIVKGASSSVHGSGAIGGVVVIKTKQPGAYLKDSDFYSDVSGTYTGVSDKYRGSTRLAYRTGSFESLINLAYWEGGETRNFEENLYKRDIDGVSGAYTLNYWAQDDLMFKAKVDYYKENLSRQAGEAKIQKDGKWKTEEYDQQTYTESYTAYVGAEYFPINSWFEELDTKFYWRNTVADEATNALISQQQGNIIAFRRLIDDRHFTDEVIGAEADFISSFSGSGFSHTLSYGVSFDTTFHERPSNSVILDWNGLNQKDAKPFASARSYVFAAHLRDVIEVDRWTITAGARVDVHQITPDSEGTIEGYKLSDKTTGEIFTKLVCFLRNHRLFELIRFL